MRRNLVILVSGLSLPIAVGTALGDYVDDLDLAVTTWNSVYGTNVIITGWTELGIIATQAERDATVSEMTDPTQVYVVEGNVTDPPTITAVLMEGASQELLDEWAAVVDGIVAIGQHKIEISWEFVATQDTFTTITVANDDPVDGIKFDSMLATIVIIEGEPVASGGRIITWIWGSTRGEIDWEVTCHAHPPVCTHDCSAWMTLGDAQIECTEEIVGNNCKLHYGWAWRTPTGSITIVWNPATLQFDVTVTGLGSSGKGDGSIIDPCPKGSCCLPDGGCEDGMGWDICESLGGTYQGDETTCAEVECPICGDGICEPGEDCERCPVDCVCVEVGCIATGPDNSLDGYLAVAPDGYGSFTSGTWGGGNAECSFGDNYNPSGGTGLSEAVFSNGFVLYAAGANQRELLSTNSNWRGMLDDASLDSTAGLVMTSDSNGDGVDDTATSAFTVTGAGVGLDFELTQVVEEVDGGVSKLTQTYLITNTGGQAVEFVLLRQADYDLLWDPDQDFANDSVGTGTNGSPECDRFAFQLEDGLPETAITVSSPQGDVYYGSKRGVATDGGVPYAYGTDFQQWNEYGVPVGWSNNIAGVGYDTDGESGPAPAGCTAPCDGAVGLSIPVSLEAGDTTEVTIMHTYGANVPASCLAGCGPCPTDVNGNGKTEAFDLAFLLGNWGAIPPDADQAVLCLDADGDGTISAFDLAVVLGSWGQCPDQELCLDYSIRSITVTEITPVDVTFQVEVGYFNTLPEPSDDPSTNIRIAVDTPDGPVEVEDQWVIWVQDDNAAGSCTTKGTGCTGDCAERHGSIQKGDTKSSFNYTPECTRFGPLCICTVFLVIHKTVPRAPDVPPDSDFFSVSVIVDPEDFLDECDEDNNSLTLEINPSSGPGCSQSCPDDSSCSITCNPGETPSCYCANLGDGPATCMCLP